jgi:hypothetical protein
VPPTATVAPVINPTVSAEPTAASGTSGENTLPECQGRAFYEPGTTVITSADVNFRTEATSDSPSLGLLPAGTQLEVTGRFTDLPDCDWWPVTNPASGDSGFVREDFLEAAPQQ